MHMAIALEKHVVVWFGPTCAQEIELYGRGVKLQADVTCSPCWRQSCDLEPKCFNQVEPARIEAAVRACIEESSLC
jgi:heptosyltransferase-2